MLGVWEVRNLWRVQGRYALLNDETRTFSSVKPAIHEFLRMQFYSRKSYILPMFITDLYDLLYHASVSTTRRDSGSSPWYVVLFSLSTFIIRDRKWSKPVSSMVLVQTATATYSEHLFPHLPPNSARFSYATQGTLFISAQLSTDAVSTLRKVWVLIWLWKQPSAHART